MSEHLSKVEIDQVVAGQGDQCPRVRAWVDGVRVVWRRRDASRNYRYSVTGWVCEEHAAGRCWHALDVEDCLSDELLARMRDRES